MLRLLNKSEIASAKATDRQKAMDEGMKLAKRVDNLREAQANEEAALEKFRRETVFQINEEIVAETEKKNALLKEVADLEDRKRLALEPLDEAWQEVENKQTELTDYAVSLNEDKLIFEESVKAYYVEVERLEIEKKRIESERKRSVKSLAQAEEYKENAASILKDAQEIKNSVVDLKKSVLQELKERDAAVAAKERDVIIREEHVSNREKEVFQKEREVNDKYETLLRSIKRHGKRI